MQLTDKSSEVHWLINLLMRSRGAIWTVWAVHIRDLLSSTGKWLSSVVCCVLGGDRRRPRWLLIAIENNDAFCDRTNKSDCLIFLGGIRRQFCLLSFLGNNLVMTETTVEAAFFIWSCHPRSWIFLVVTQEILKLFFFKRLNIVIKNYTMNFQEITKIWKVLILQEKCVLSYIMTSYCKAEK